MSSSFKIARIGGITISIHATWIIAFFFIAWTIQQLFSDSFESWGPARTWVGGVVGSLALFASVLVHELAHSFMAKRLGLPVEGITLFIFGGVSQIRGHYTRARDEFLVAFAGPLSSLIIGGVALLAWTLFQPERGDPNLVLGVIFYVGFMNVVLGVFNLLPGFPLDGGRVLRAIVWGWAKSETTGTRVATTVGSLVAWILIGFGVYQFLNDNLIGGIWMAFIGLFLQGASRGERRAERMRNALERIPLRSVIQRTPRIASSTDRVVDVLTNIVDRGMQRIVPIVEDGEPVGFFTREDASRFPDYELATLAVGRVIRRETPYTVQMSDDAAEVLENLIIRNSRFALVLAGDAVIGVVGAADLEALIRFSNSDYDFSPPG